MCYATLTHFHVTQPRNPQPFQAAQARPATTLKDTTQPRPGTAQRQQARVALRLRPGSVDNAYTPIWHGSYMTGVFPRMPVTFSLPPVGLAVFPFFPAPRKCLTILLAMRAASHYGCRHMSTNGKTGCGRRVTVRLNGELLEWASAQAGTLSEVVRGAMYAAMMRGGGARRGKAVRK